jgi:hypothetical protein
VTFLIFFTPLGSFRHPNEVLLFPAGCSSTCRSHDARILAQGMRAAWPRQAKNGPEINLI